MIEAPNRPSNTLDLISNNQMKKCDGQTAVSFQGGSFILKEEEMHYKGSAPGPGD